MVVLLRPFFEWVVMAASTLNRDAAEFPKQVLKSLQPSAAEFQQIIGQAMAGVGLMPQTLKNFTQLLKNFDYQKPQHIQKVHISENYQ